jgi:hypothetical protein
MKIIFWLFMITLFHGCVSVNLPKSSGVKAEKVAYRAPASPFSEINSENADQAWISEKKGNTISYLSDCNNPVDPPLAQIEAETLAVLSDLKILNTERINFNSREALQTLAQGQVDGVVVRMKLVTFKKNSCSYTLVYGGLKRNFDSEMGHFDNFIKGFRAP